jgi:hypothetical protein
VTQEDLAVLCKSTGLAPQIWDYRVLVSSSVDFHNFRVWRILRFRAVCNAHLGIRQTIGRRTIDTQRYVTHNLFLSFAEDRSRIILCPFHHAAPSLCSHSSRTTRGLFFISGSPHPSLPDTYGNDIFNFKATFGSSPQPFQIDADPKFVAYTYLKASLTHYTVDLDQPDWLDGPPKHNVSTIRDYWTDQYD